MGCLVMDEVVPMPDMSQPGAHLQECLNDLKFRAEECRAESRKQATLADAFEAAARKLERAMREEAQKARVLAGAPGSPKLYTEATVGLERRNG